MRKERLLNRLGLLVGGLALGVTASIIVGLWDKMTAVDRGICLAALTSLLYIGWLLLQKNNESNDGEDYSTNSPSRIVEVKPCDESNNDS